MTNSKPRVEPGSAPARLLAALSDRPCLIADLIEQVDPTAEFEHDTWRFGMWRLMQKGMARNLTVKRGGPRNRGQYVITEQGQLERERVLRQGRAA